MKEKGKFVTKKHYENMHKTPSINNLVELGKIGIASRYKSEIVKGKHIGLFVIEDVYFKNDCLEIDKLFCRSLLEEGKSVIIYPEELKFNEDEGIYYQV